MLIALDYDGTYTADPALWLSFAESARHRGHRVVVITMRRPDEPIDVPFDVVYTSRRAKAPHAAEIGLKPDVWIDDRPAWIYEDSY